VVESDDRRASIRAVIEARLPTTSGMGGLRARLRQERSCAARSYVLDEMGHSRLRGPGPQIRLRAVDFARLSALYAAATYYDLTDDRRASPW
jgi:hypothetical protein